MTGNYEMKLPELNQFSTMAASTSDLKDKVNLLQSEKRQIRLSMHAKQEQINVIMAEIERMEKRE